MPQFFTSIVNDHSIDRDDEGQNFESPDAAIASARRSALGLLSEHLADDGGAAAFKVFVEDEKRERLATISVMGAVVR